ncbi:MAG: DUF892 family protein [Clostridiales bacterium]|nr:DUF892 family protein [Clostridiales bacterium]MBQ2769069.1 DUF892 family protein [Clostridia bacterium]
MKLEKREVTLNEADSLKDMFYMEKTLLLAYGDALERAQRKEVKAVLSELKKETEKEMAFVERRLQKSLSRFLEIAGNGD